MPADSFLHSARAHTGRVRQELQVAGAELHLTHTALEASLPPAAKDGNVARALEQNAAIEEKVLEAADDLAKVTRLLDEEVAQRVRLEIELAQERRSPEKGE